MKVINKLEHIMSEESYVPMSIRQFLILHFCSFGLYSFVWWFRAWYNLLFDPQKKYCLNIINISIHTILSPLLCFHYFIKVSDFANQKRVRFYWDPLVLALLYLTGLTVFLLYVFVRNVSYPLFALFGALSFFVLLPIQLTINKMVGGKENKISLKLMLPAILLGSIAWVAVLSMAYVNCLSYTAQGRIALNNQMYQRAYHLIAAEAESGDAPAQVLLAYMYTQGMGTKADYAKAIKWYRKAVEQDHPLGFYGIAHMYQNGYGMERNYETAALYYELASRHGVARAQTKLAALYEQGLGLQQDTDRAIDLYYGAAKSGDSHAQYHIANHFTSGTGLQKDNFCAHFWYSKAAQSGNICAQNELAKLYAAGKGVPQDSKKAIHWFSRVASITHDQTRTGRHDGASHKQYVNSYVKYMLGKYSDKESDQSKLSKYEIEIAKRIEQQHADYCWEQGQIIEV